MSESIKPTPGPWNWDSDQIKGDPLGRVRFRVVTSGKTITQCYYSSSDEHAKDDARLIAEAGTVFHETQCTPRQLVERVKELEEALRDMHSGWRYIRMSHGDLYGVGWDRCEEKASAALSRSLPNTVAEVK